VKATHPATQASSAIRLDFESMFSLSFLNSPHAELIDKEF
jgi:hypothetical protein